MKPTVLILVVILCISMFPVLAAVEVPSVENGSFESELYLWTHGEISTSFPYAGTNCLSILSSDDMADGFFKFSTEYQKNVWLTKNSVYEFTFFARTDLSEITLSPKCHIDFPPEKKNICMQVSGLTSEWQKISSTFMVDRSDFYVFSIESVLGFKDDILFIDDVSLCRVDFKPEGITALGTRTVTIPDAGVATYTYNPVVFDQFFSTHPIQNGMITSEDNLPTGVSFDSKTGVLSVDHTASPNQCITLFCSLSGTASAPSFPVEITLSKNVLQNGNFNDLPLNVGWSTKNAMCSVLTESDSFFAQVPTSKIGENIYKGTLTPEHAVVLYASHLYVFRAKVRSDVLYTSRNIRADALGPDSNNMIRFQISDVSGNQWNEVSAAFRVPNDGIYTISMDLISFYDQPVYIDDVIVQPEEKEPVSIYFDAPLHISRPADETIQIPLETAVLNQFGLPQPYAVSFAVEPESADVRVVDGVLTVSPAAQCQEYVIIASLRDNIGVQSRRSIQISDKSVFDGSFENTKPGQAWITAEPSSLHYVSTYKDIYPSDGGLLARLTMNGAVSMVMSDSFYRYDKEHSYVFEADMSMLAPDIDTVVTVLVDNAHSDSFDDNLVIGQFKLSKEKKHIQHLFSPTETVSGRLMIAFNTDEAHDQQVVFMDKISIVRAAVYVSSVSIGGSPYLDKNIVGIYRFSSNFDAVDASIYRWLISDTPNGIFMPIAGENDNVLSITSSMLHKYVKFEVTPVSLTGPVTGDSVTSSIILLGEPISSGTISNPVLPDASSPAPPDPPEDADNEMQRAKIHALDLRNFSVIEKATFFDLQNHWAAEDIELLTSVGVLQGRGNGLFAPQEQITRAEFSAILARAFQLAPILYKNLFTDVKGSHWYAGAIAVVTKHGIAQGTSQTTFSPDLPISREEMAVMIMRAYRKAGASTKPVSLSYVDQTEFSAWAMQDILEAGALGLMNGLPDGTFMPKKNATRAEAAVVIRRMLSHIAENTK